MHFEEASDYEERRKIATIVAARDRRFFGRLLWLIAPAQEEMNRGEIFPRRDENRLRKQYRRD